MYPVIWDPETRGILLLDHASADAIQGEVRPVCFEELDLLGLGQHWSYPHPAEPLLWAVGRRYYYRGEFVAEAKGGGFFETPQVFVQREELDIEPVDVDSMLARNAAILEGLAFRAVEFIHDQYHQRRRRADIFAVAFSGGKDSLVTLDLVQRALAPDEFVVVFADTTMELQATYDAVESAQKRFPHLRFHVARSHLTAPESWRLFGPPSRIHRWCCSVHKTAPTMLKLRELVGTAAVDAVVFDGCRREESQRRFGYTAVSAGCKHPTQVNISPILEWNSAETFLYVLSRALAINRGYRLGLARVGCAVCPFDSQSGEFVAWHEFSRDTDLLLAELIGYAKDELGTQDGVTEYIRSGRWKIRSGGRALAVGGNRVIEAESSDSVSFRIRRRSQDWSEWFQALGTIRWEGPGKGWIETTNASYPFQVLMHDESTELTVHTAGLADRFFRRDLRSLANKTAYCIRCRACEVECPTGALTANGKVEINDEQCIHCGNCLTFVEKGCWVAKCLSVSVEGAGMKGVNAYQTFGMAREWLAEYFQSPETWWRDNPRGPRQFEAMRVWLHQAEIVDRKKNAITDLGRRLQHIRTDNPVTWEIIWTNLARNSVLVRWYVGAVSFGQFWTKADLVELMGTELPHRTRENAITSLLRLLAETPLGEELGLGRLDAETGRTKRFTKARVTNLHPVALLYSLYRYAEAMERYDLSVGELLDEKHEGPVALFGLDEESLRKALRGLSSTFGQWIRTEIVRDLDSVYLERSRRSEEVLSLV